jgi:hypothetical protein
MDDIPRILCRIQDQPHGNDDRRGDGEDGAGEDPRAPTGLSSALLGAARLQLALGGFHWGAFGFAGDAKEVPR